MYHINNNVFSCVLKVVRLQLDIRNTVDKLFHIEGPETAKLLSPQPVFGSREPKSLHEAWGFRLWRIKWCDCHLCHMTKNTHIHGWAALYEKAILFWCLFESVTLHMVIYYRQEQNFREISWSISYLLFFPRFPGVWPPLQAAIVAPLKTAAQKDLAGDYDRTMPTVDKQQQQGSNGHCLLLPKAFRLLNSKC